MLETIEIIGIIEISTISIISIIGVAKLLKQLNSAQFDLFQFLNYFNYLSVWNDRETPNLNNGSPDFNCFKYLNRQMFEMFERIETLSSNTYKEETPTISTTETFELTELI